MKVLLIFWRRMVKCVKVSSLLQVTDGWTDRGAHVPGGKMDVVGYDDEVEENSMTSLEEDAEIQSSVGSSVEMAEGDDIPFGAVSHSILKRMAVYLEPLCDLGDRDWRALASKILNASPAQIMVSGSGRRSNVLGVHRHRVLRKKGFWNKLRRERNYKN